MNVKHSEDGARAAGKVRSGDTPGHRLHMLVVDDHLDTLKAMQRLLQFMGHEVAAAATMAEALALAQTFDFDLILSDLKLPDGSGHELLRRLRTFTNPVAVAISGFGSEEDRAKSRQSGFFAHLTKPASLQALERVISAAVGPAKVAEGV